MNTEKYDDADLLQRDQQWLSLLAMKQLKNIGVFLFRNWHWPDVLTWHDIKKKIR
jgi:hypothetical protein